MAERLTVKVEKFGPDQRAHDRVAKGLVRSGALREQLGKADHRLLALEMLEPERKTAAPRTRDRYRATYYDYTNGRAVHVEGHFGEAGRRGGECLGAAAASEFGGVRRRGQDPAPAQGARPAAA